MRNLLRPLSIHTFRRRILAFAAALALCGVGYSQAITSGQIVGRVLDSEGSPVDNIRVSIRHIPTGAEQESLTRGNGSFSARGLRPGGPYTVSVDEPGYAASARRDVFVALDRAAEVVLQLSDEGVVELDAVQVRADEFGLLFSPDRIGAATSMDEDAIERAPAGDRSLNALLRFDPRIVYNRNPQDQAISAGGISNRYNQIQADGVSANDPFGLNSNNTAASRNVVPMDSISAVSVSTSPFDARQGGFTGASVNAVTRSGGNEMSGSLYYLFRSDSLVREELETNSGDVIEVPEFDEQTYGFTLGGPILTDKLFYFLAYEEVSEDRNPPTLTNAPTAESLQRIGSAAAVLGIDPGSISAPALELTDENILFKVDWNINNDHSMSWRYNDVVSSRPSFPGYGGRNLSFDTHWYDQSTENTSYITQLYSRWTDRFSTEAALSFSQYASEPLFQRALPQVRINDVPVEGTTQLGSVYFGAERSRHFNRLEVDTWTLDLSGEYQLNERNALSFGYQLSRADVYNAFVQDFLGNYEFDSIEAFEAASEPGWSGRYQYKFASDGVNPAAEFRESNHAVFLQNVYRPNERLTVQYGLRADRPDFAEAPPENPLFEQTFGISNQNTYKGNTVVQPRLGFNLAMGEDGQNQLRGGVGLFYGQMPRVWMSNSYSNTGLNFNSIDVGDDATPAFSPDAANQPLLDPAAAAQQVVALDPDFELPSRWKALLGYDHRFGEYVLSAELEMTEVNKDVLFRNINRSVNTVAFDGREILGGRISEDFVNDTIVLGNTSQGRSRSFVLAVNRAPTENGWSWRGSYANTSVDEVHYGTSSVARSNWANRSILNQGEDEVGRGELEIKHRFFATVEKEIRWGESDQRTVLALVYEGRSGLPFSFVASNDVNGDGVTFQDRIYIPERGDSRVQFATAEDENLFFQMVDQWGLATGQVAAVGAGRYNFSHQFDFSVTHEFKLPGWKHRMEISLDILNMGNLLNSEWGLIRGSNSFFKKAEGAARVDYDPATDTYAYSNVNAELAAGSFSPFSSRGEPDVSRWSGMVSLRYRF